MFQKNSNKIEGIKRSSYLKEVFIIYYRIFFLNGLDLTSESKISKCRKLCLVLLNTVALSARISFSLYLIFFLATVDVELSVMSFYISILLIQVELVFLHFVFLVRGHKMKQLLQILDEIIAEFIGKNSKEYRTIAIAVNVSLLLHFIFINVYTITGFCTLTPQDNTKFIPGHIFLSSFLANYVNIHIIPDSAAKMFYFIVIMTLSTHIFIVMFYLTICFIFIYLFNILQKLSLTKPNDSQATKTNSTWNKKSKADVIWLFLKRHQKLCKAVTLVEGTFTQIFVVLTLAELISIIFLTRAMDLTDSLAGLGSELLGPFLLFWITFIWKSVCASVINDKVRSIFSKWRMLSIKQTIIISVNMSQNRVTRSDITIPKMCSD